MLKVRIIKYSCVIAITAITACTVIFPNQVSIGDFLERNNFKIIKDKNKFDSINKKIIEMYIGEMANPGKPYNSGDVFQYVHSQRLELGGERENMALVYYSQGGGIMGVTKLLMMLKYFPDSQLMICQFSIWAPPKIKQLIQSQTPGSIHKSKECSVVDLDALLS